MTQSMLDDIVIIYEGPDEGVVGDFSIHLSEGDACAAVEPWWVRDDEGQAYTAAGTRLVLDVDPSGRVFVSRREVCAEGAGIVLAWLQSLARMTLDRRVEAAAKGRVVLSQAEERGALPDTVEGLLAYVGVPWMASRDMPWFGCPLLLLLVAIAGLLVAMLLRST